MTFEVKEKMLGNQPSIAFPSSVRKVLKMMLVNDLLTVTDLLDRSVFHNKNS